MNHKLRILVLKHLQKKPLSGYGLIKEIQEVTGWKPSYGSMYPLLDNLKQKGLLSVQEEGKKKIYHLTQEGEKEVQRFRKMHSDMIMEMRDKIKLMSHMLGFGDKRHDEITDLFFSAIKKGKTPFKEIMKSSAELKIALWELYKKGLIKKHSKEINKIIGGATEKIKNLAVHNEKK